MRKLSFLLMQILENIYGQANIFSYKERLFNFCFFNKLLTKVQKKLLNL